MTNLRELQFNAVLQALMLTSASRGRSVGIDRPRRDPTNPASRPKRARQQCFRIRRAMGLKD